jgi:hypothetical protein
MSSALTSRPPVSWKGPRMPAFEVILRRPNRPDAVHYRNQADAQVGDVLQIEGRPWVIVAKEPPFALRRIERIVCVRRTVRKLHWSCQPAGRRYASRTAWPTRLESIIEWPLMTNQVDSQAVAQEISAISLQLKRLDRRAIQ